MSYLAQGGALHGLNGFGLVQGGGIAPCARLPAIAYAHVVIEFLLPTGTGS